MSAARVGEFLAWGDGSQGGLSLPTPALAAALQDWQQNLGFTLRQHIPGVWAMLACGGLRVQLWQQLADQPLLQPVQLRVVVRDVFHLHSRLAYQACTPLSGAPQRTPLGSWEFSLLDRDGNSLQLVQWPHDVNHLQVARALAARPSSARISSVWQPMRGPQRPASGPAAA
ncbi:hypothetical protein [Variovorax sp. HJSM1_2]|uniref:hypothetical protein n=1 Tax=Variovorax sp. HJSM1_2 TaxID=3366263 RepID=UPI003BE9A5D9